MSDVDELMPSRPATLRDAVSPDQIVVEYHKLTYFPSQPWFKRYPVDETVHVVNSRKLMQWCLNFSLIFGYMGDGGALQIACFLFGTDASSGAIFVFLTPGVVAQFTAQCVCTQFLDPYTFSVRYETRVL